ERQRALWGRPLEPVSVAWDGLVNTVKLRLPSSRMPRLLRGHIAVDTGEKKEMEWKVDNLQVLQSEEIDGTSYFSLDLPISMALPTGYHRFTLELPGEKAETLILAAPSRVNKGSHGKKERDWGLFIPLYALHSEQSWGCGDLSDMENLINLTGELGGTLAGTLPLLPCFLEEPFDPSPYKPVSRLFWNEVFLDLKRIPEWERCPRAQDLAGSASFSSEIAALRASSLVDYRQLITLKRAVLKELSRYFFSGSSNNQAAFRKFVKDNPLVEDYARFRAFHEKTGASWTSWPETQKKGFIRDIDCDKEVFEYHIYAQWAIFRQMGELSAVMNKKGVNLYLDLPLGVHPDGYDAWREQEIFASGTSTGSPPDPFFTGGQNWRFPPLHPEKIRDQGYSYIVRCLRHHMKHAGALRIDHVMGFHRLFWIPGGMEPGEGIYVRYRPEEFYALITLEATRNGTTVVGEDLGTVPSSVRPAMKRHGLNRMYIAQFEISPCNPVSLPAPPSDCLAGINTHDTPTFSGFWQGLDIKQRGEMNLLDNDEITTEERLRQAAKDAIVSLFHASGDLPGNEYNQAEVLKAFLTFLARSQARLVMVNLEDLWQEINPQNVPGTEKEWPNWQRKARFSIEEFRNMPRVIEVLKEVNRLRMMPGPE
ncbi:MAG: 4-alpha-glucanotransferase, partial [Dehalococcoidia bacterium]|nr:4-alpha-glucanotransferase [Dehalococcoidia bacterium]